MRWCGWVAAGVAVVVVAAAAVAVAAVLVVLVVVVCVAPMIWSHSASDKRFSMRNTRGPSGLFDTTVRLMAREPSDLTSYCAHQ